MNEIRTGSKPRLVAVLPTSLTLGNAVCGFAAISYATLPADGGDAMQPLCVAAFLILLAMAFDALDGSVARMTQQTSQFGAELDSLCDLVSFGVAPAVLLVQLPHWIPSRMLWCIALLFVLCAALRLARFNADRSEHDSQWFRGLPSPAAAGAFASIVLIWPGVLQFATGDASPGLRRAAEVATHVLPAVIPWLSLLLACLMITSIRYPHPVKQVLQGKRPLIYVVQAYFLLAALFAVHELALPLIFLAFALGSPLRALAGQVTLGIERSSAFVRQNI